jgi:RimJ/RimL family protein N-acetyltransferase
VTGDGAATSAVVRVRPATDDDAALLFSWRNDPEVRRWSRSTQEMSAHAHNAWLRGVLADPDRHLLLVLRAADGEPVGTTRYDRLTGGAEPAHRSRWEISITVAPGMRGQGFGSATLQACDSWLRRTEPASTEIVAHVRPANTGSRALFERNGYREIPSDEVGLDCLVRVLGGR